MTFDRAYTKKCFKKKSLWFQDIFIKLIFPIGLYILGCVLLYLFHLTPLFVIMICVYILLYTCIQGISNGHFQLALTYSALYLFHPTPLFVILICLQCVVYLHSRLSADPGFT